jgi:hypothetical protein
MIIGPYWLMLKRPLASADKDTNPEPVETMFE